MVRVSDMTYCWSYSGHAAVGRGFRQDPQSLGWSGLSSVKACFIKYGGVVYTRRIKISRSDDLQKAGQCNQYKIVLSQTLDALYDNEEGEKGSKGSIEVCFISEKKFLKPKFRVCVLVLFSCFRCLLVVCLLVCFRSLPVPVDYLSVASIYSDISAVSIQFGIWPRNLLFCLYRH